MASVRPLQSRLPSQPTRPAVSAHGQQPMGVTREGDEAQIRFWAPAARQVELLVNGQPAGDLKPAAEGFWQGSADWHKVDGQVYGFAVSTPEGTTLLKADPYARRMQGQLRGVGELYLSSKTGQEVTKDYKLYPQPQTPVEPQVHPPGQESGPSKRPPAQPAPLDNQGNPIQPTASAVPFWRFEVQQQPGADKVCLRLFDANGQALTRDQLQRRLGDRGGDLVHRFQPGQALFWKDACQPDGRISLQPEGSDAWATVLNQPERLQGLHYRFEVYRDRKIVGDSDQDGQLSACEARQTVYNDAWSDKLERINDQRLGIVHADDYVWKNPSPSLDPNKAVTYQLHIGSFMGQASNMRRSTFKDVMERIDDLKELGITHIELLPVNPFEGQRDWGYIGTQSLAVAEQYGFVDDDGTWVAGDEALKRFVDAAHGKQMAVINDVVYNHWGGDYNNLWELDGKANSYLNWGDGLHNTPWGPMPAFNKAPVRQLVLDSVMQQFDEFHVDGLRFDFTHPIHADDGGGQQGMSLLREIGSQVHAKYPQASLEAEEFPNDPIMTDPPEQGGAGFNGMWNTEFQHRLIHDGWNPSILQQAVQSKKTNMDQFMGHLVNHPGFRGATHSVTILSNHDEVGNADRTINVARDSRLDNPPNDWQKAAARSVFAIGMLSPGRPLLFQGEETLAENRFRWGIPSTWDTTPADTTHRDFCQAAIALRHSSPAFDADCEASRVYTHNDNSVMAYRRQKGGEDYVVVASLNKKDLTDYSLPLPGGPWELVLNTDSTEFGGHNLGRARVAGGEANRLDLPAAGVLVYRRLPN